VLLIGRIKLSGNMIHKANRPKMTGAGDLIAAITRTTGIDKIAKFVAKATGNEDCGCAARQQKANELLPFKRRAK